MSPSRPIVPMPRDRVGCARGRCTSLLDAASRRAPAARSVFERGEGDRSRRADVLAREPHRRARDEALHVLEVRRSGGSARSSRPAAARPATAARTRRRRAPRARTVPTTRLSRRRSSMGVLLSANVARRPACARTPSMNSRSVGMLRLAQRRGGPSTAIRPSFSSATRSEIAKHELEIVGHHDRGDARARAGARWISSPMRREFAGIEAGGRLVVEDDLRLERDRARHADALAHAARELGGHQRLARPTRPTAVEALRARARAIALLAPAHVLADRVRDVLVDRQRVEQRGALEDHAEVAPHARPSSRSGSRRHVAAEHGDRARVGRAAGRSCASGTPTCPSPSRRGS